MFSVPIMLCMGDMSRKVMNILSEFTPDIEIYLIDEAFLLLRGFEEHFNL